MITSKDIFKVVVLTFVIAFSIAFVFLLIGAVASMTIARSAGITAVAGGVSERLFLLMLIGLAMAPGLAYLIKRGRKGK